MPAIKFKKLSKTDHRQLDNLRTFYSIIRNVFFDREYTTEKTKDKLAYSAIPQYPSIIDSLAIIRKTFIDEYLCLIDVGSGKGNIVAIAESVGFDYSTGIEFNESYKGSVIGRTSVFLWQDANTVTQEQIDNQTNRLLLTKTKRRNIFHIYQIYKDNEKLAKIYHHYYNLARPGDIILISGDLPEEIIKLGIYGYNNNFRYLIKD